MRRRLLFVCWLDLYLLTAIIAFCKRSSSLRLRCTSLPRLFFTAAYLNKCHRNYMQVRNSLRVFTILSGGGVDTLSSTYSSLA